MILNEGISPLMIRQKIQADMLLPGLMAFGLPCVSVGDNVDPTISGSFYGKTILCEYLHYIFLCPRYQASQPSSVIRPFPTFQDWGL